MTFIRRDDTKASEVEPGLYGLKLLDGGHGSQRVSLVRGWMRPGARHSAHTHEVEEAVVFLGGRGLLEVAGERHDVGPGDVVHIPPGVVHSTLNTGDENLIFIAAFADNLIASNPLRTSGELRGDTRPGASVRHRLAWLLRRIAGRLTRHARGRGPAS